MSETTPWTTRPTGSRTFQEYRLLPYPRIELSGTEPAPSPDQRFRGRIGSHASSGFYAAPHRYHLYLSLACPHSLRTAIIRSLMGLQEQVSMTALPPIPDAAGPTGAAGGLGSLREAYETTRYRYEGPVTVPALCDRWSGRIVSNYAPDILRDLATRFPAGDGPELYPAGSATDIEAIEALLDEDVTEAAQCAGRAAAGHRDGEALHTVLAALAVLDEQLATHAYLLGDALTAADVHLWTTLVHLDAVHRRHLDAEAVHRIADHPRLWAYASRLNRQPSFRDSLRLDHIARRHRWNCRGPEASGAAVQIMDWTADRTPGNAPA